MRQFNGYLLPDPGKYFKSNNTIYFKISADADYEELEINTDNIEILGDYIFVDKTFAVTGKDYNSLKKNLINKVYSNDDELAILLNYQASKTKENTDKIKLLQDWREWCGNLAKIIQLKLS